MAKSTWIICTTSRDGQGWRWYSDANTSAEIEAAFNAAAAAGSFATVAAFRHVTGWWEHKPAYVRNLAPNDAPLPAGTFGFINQLDAGYF
jgi:hypothetical protein